MDITEAYMVTFQMHDHDENFGISNELVRADSIGTALSLIGDWLDKLMEENDWSDYHITNINVIPELH